jgi:hypothetical protein
MYILTSSHNSFPINKRIINQLLGFTEIWGTPFPVTKNIEMLTRRLLPGGRQTDHPKESSCNVVFNGRAAAGVEKRSPTFDATVMDINDVFLPSQDSSS